MWGCDKTDGKLWDICHNRAAPLHFDRRHTSPRLDLPLAPLSCQAPVALQAEETALWMPLWTLMQGLGWEQTPSAAAAWASTEPQCCCLAD